MQIRLLFLIVAICFTVISGVPINFQQKESLNEDRANGLAFFDQFQSMFGWGGEETPATTFRPPPLLNTPLPARPHEHTATAAPYYGGHAPHHPGGYHAPAPYYAGSGQPPRDMKPRSTSRGAVVTQPPHGPPGHAHPTQSPLPPVPGMYPQQQSTQYNPLPGQYPGVPQYNPYQYPPQAYYNSPYYNPYYRPAVVFPHTQPSYYPQAPLPMGGMTRNSPQGIPTIIPEEGDNDPEDSSKVPNKHKAVPNKAAMPNPIFKLPFPVTKSMLPLSVLSPEDCHSEAGLVGECLSANDCGATSGHPSGLCHMGRDVSLHARVCCVYPAHCGYETNHRVTYFKSPNYPQPASVVSDCPFTVNLLPGVCQVRLDFLDFKMKPVLHGICDEKNSLLIKSSHSSTLIPMNKMCGTVATGLEDPLRTDIPHLYTHFDIDPAPEKNAKKVPNKDTRPSLELHFNVENYPSMWNIRVSQIICDGANLQAPTGCSQYYNSNSGNITSINLPDKEYMADTSLDICLARDPTACAIKYKMKTMGVGATKGGGLGYGLVCDDFLKFRGEKTGICGRGEGREMVLPVKGPVGLTFQSDSSNIPGADVGYSLEYEYLHNCDGVQFYQYPNSKQ